MNEDKTGPDGKTSPAGSAQDRVTAIKGRRRGIYLLPNLLTTGAMFAGFYAVLASMDGNFAAAAIAVFVAMFFDGLDGRVARMTNTQSDFGIQYDSLSDMVSFGMAPAILAFSWALHEVGRVGWAAAFVYASCAALRLARFNTQAGSADRRYFTGLASPAAAAVIAALAWSLHSTPNSRGFVLLVAFVTAAVGLLMVSGFRYHSFKDLDIKDRVPFVVILAIAMGIVVVTIDPPRILLLMAVLYAVSGPVMRVISWHRARESLNKRK